MDRHRSWVSNLVEVQARRRDAERLVGLRLTAVRYCEIDYARLDRPDGHEGPRLVTGEAAWQEPSFRFEFGDVADYGVELEVTADRVFTVSWESPGMQGEGLWLLEVPVIGHAVVPEASTAIWDVSRAGRWDRFTGEEIADVRLHYRPWGPDDGYWCPRITMTIGGLDIEFLGGQAESAKLRPSADSVAVLFPPAALPEWEEYDDEV